MSTSALDIGLGPGALVALGGYFFLMAGLALVARRRRTDGGLEDHYLANRGLGFVLLLLTLYATQYSGNSLIGYPGEAYRLGFSWIMSVGFMMAVVVAYLCFAPRLYERAKTARYLTPGDWIEDRFRSPALTLLANLVFLVTITNFLLAQLMAMGYVVSALSGQVVPYWMGVLGLGVVVVLYESIGGMRAVVWTDALQALLLFVGITGMLLAVLSGADGLATATRWIIEHEPQKAVVPPTSSLVSWASTLLLVGLSASIYPQAIQRIFAARNTRALKTSLATMSFLPLVTLFPVFLVGILAIPTLQGLEGLAADQVLPQLVSLWATESLLHYLLALLVMIGAVAAIMSTADSMLLSLSSILAKDVLGQHVLRSSDDQQLARLGRRLSWAIMAGLILVASTPRLSLWGLTELKLEILVQAAPLFFLGANWRGFQARGAMAGLVLGVALAVAFALTGVDKLANVHGGLVALALNVSLGVGLSVTRPTAFAAGSKRF